MMMLRMMIIVALTKVTMMLMKMLMMMMVAKDDNDNDNEESGCICFFDLLCQFGINPQLARANQRTQALQLFGSSVDLSADQSLRWRMSEHVERVHSQ